MADQKISSLTDYPTPLNADLLPVVDTVNTTTKKTTWTNIKATLKAYFDTIYQAILVSGTSIKTINSASLLGSGDIVLSADTIPKYVFSTIFETAARFTATVVGNGTVAFFSATTLGPLISSSATTTNSASLVSKMMNTNGMEVGNPIFSFCVTTEILTVASGAGSMYFGLGAITVAGAGHTFTNSHIGFKIIKAAGVASLYATQSGGTETASVALTTLADFDALELIVKINGTASVDYYWRKNGGALSTATNLTTNMPTGIGYVQLSISNNSTAFNFAFSAQSFSYSR